MAIGLLLMATPAVADLDSAERCHASRVEHIGQYGRCRMQVSSAARAAGEVPDYSSCEATFTRTWANTATARRCDLLEEGTGHPSVAPAVESESPSSIR